MSELTKAISELNKQFGDGTIITMDSGSVACDFIPSGSVALDIALGGGIPRGRIIEVFGPESGGKTTTCLHVCAEAQKMGLNAILIDVEHAFDPVWGRKLGVDLSKLMISQPSSGEEALGICDRLSHGAVGLIIVDSVAALTPEVERQSEPGQTNIGVLARLLGPSIKRLTASCKKSNTTVLFINQIREKIGVVYGNKETTPGGAQLKFHASQRLDVRRCALIKDGDEITGQRVKVRVAKNKVARPFKTAEFDLLFDSGLSKESDLIDIAPKYGIMEKRGSHYYYKGEKIGNGKEKTRQTLVDNPEMVAEMSAAVMAAVKGEEKSE